MCGDFGFIGAQVRALLMHIKEELRVTGYVDLLKQRRLGGMMGLWWCRPVPDLSQIKVSRRHAGKNVTMSDSRQEPADET